MKDYYLLPKLKMSFICPISTYSRLCQADNRSMDRQEFCRFRMNVSLSTFSELNVWAGEGAEVGADLTRIELRAGYSWEL